MANFKDSQDQRTNTGIMKPLKSSCHKKFPYTCKIKTDYYLEVMTNVIFFIKKVKCQSQQKDLFTSNIHIKYARSRTH